MHLDNDADIKMSENAMELPDESRCSLGLEANFRSSISEPTLSGLENSNTKNDDRDDNKEEEGLPRIEQNQLEEEVVKKRRRRRIREVESLLRMQKGVKLGSSIIEYQKQGRPFSNYVRVYIYTLDALVYFLPLFSISSAWLQCAIRVEKI